MSFFFITFIFKLNGDTTFYGKYYTDKISPDHTGLDEEVKPYLLRGISEHQKIQKRPEITEKVRIGIISVSNHEHMSIHSTNEERFCFDFYCENFTINHKKCMEMYMFGKLVKNSPL